MNEKPQLVAFLSGVINDVYKLLPMREEADSGKENYIDKYLETLLVNLTGAEDIYIGISTDKRYLYVVNNIAYLQRNPVDFGAWRRIVLNSVRLLNNLHDTIEKSQKEV